MRKWETCNTNNNPENEENIIIYGTVPKTGHKIS
jgi:hypothetical protein